ncbi:olfactory receptor 7G1-like [Paralichthys olivaceus]|uniref:olfactory receptor 7G1-like n=1 Tax=Paralichthys olivaceus TaxID=8255 RepID=UPI003753AF59
MSASGFGMTFVTACVVLSSVVREQTQLFGRWCIVQFCILRCFFLTSQMTLALMAVERYVFICHGIHYLRLINTNNVHMSLGLLWLVSVAASYHGGSVLNHIKHGPLQQTSGFVCDAVTIKELITFTLEEDLQVFGPPSVITTFCILAICYCYGCMYQAALRVSVALKCNNHRANCTVGLYLLMFLLQMVLSIFFIILTVMGKTKSPTWRRLTPVLTPLLLTVPPCINAAFLLIRNPQIKHLLFSLCRQKCPWAVVSEVEVLQQSTVEHMRLDKDGQNTQSESFTHPVTPPAATRKPSEDLK